MDLKKWLPFKFNRKKKNETNGASKTTLAPASWQEAGHLMNTDPFRLMQEFVRDPFFGLGPMERWFGDHSPTMFHPNIDVVDEGKSIRISAELPGLDKDDIELTIQEGALSLSGEKRTESSSDEEGCYRTERAYGYFERVVPLPGDVDLDHIDADFKKGVLTVHVPKLKTAESRGKQIPIS